MTVHRSAAPTGSTAPAVEGAPQAFVASDSPLLVAGTVAVLRKEGIVVAGGSRRLATLETEDAAAFDAVVVVPANWLVADLVSTLQDRPRFVPTVFLLSDAALLMHGEALSSVDAVGVPITAPGEDIGAAIRGAVDPAPAPSVRSEEAVHGPGGALTPREQESLEAAAQGMTNRAIGETLGVGEETAKSHMTSVYRKLGVKNRAEAVAAYLEAR